MSLKNDNLTAADISMIAKLAALRDIAKDLAKYAQSDIDVLREAREQGDMDYSQDTVILDDYRQQVANAILAIRYLQVR